MTTAIDQAQLSIARGAAEAALALLPTSQPLQVGAPGTQVPDPLPAGQAITARFTGAANGEVVVVVGQDLADALSTSPLGALDLPTAIRPALEAAAGAFGPVVVDPGQLLEPAAALSALVSKGDAVVVPLVNGADVRAAVALRLSPWPTGAAAPAASGAAAPNAGLAAQRRAQASGGAPRPASLDLLHDVEMEVSAELGRTQMSVKELLGLQPGAVIELDRAAGSPADLLVNGRLIARGEVVVVDENFGIRITEIVSPNTER